MAIACSKASLISCRDTRGVPAIFGRSLVATGTSASAATRSSAEALGRSNGAAVRLRTAVNELTRHFTRTTPAHNWLSRVGIYRSPIRIRVLSLRQAQTAWPSSSSGQSGSPSGCSQVRIDSGVASSKAGVRRRRLSNTPTFSLAPHIAYYALAGGQLIGFVTALSDGVLSAYIPLLEVLAEFRSTGIGSELVERLVAEIGPLYMVDVMCDPDVFPFYERLGFRPSTGGVVRNYRWRDASAPNRR